MMIKLPLSGSKRRREPPGVLDGQNQKRLKMDRGVKLQCSRILKTLINHPAGWVFRTPVDPVALHIPDYPLIISHPMDLGTVRRKLEDNAYLDVEEFVADVKLTFSNAMLYNPPSNTVHKMAKTLDNIFSKAWRSLQAKGVHESKYVKQGFIEDGRAKNAEDTRNACHGLLPKTSMSSEEKKRLRKELVEVSREKMTEHLRGFLRKYGLICSKEEKIERDISSLDDETLWELRRVIKGSLDAKEVKTEPAKVTQNGGPPLVVKFCPKGQDNGNRVAYRSEKTKPPSTSVASNCASCGHLACQCILQNESANASSSYLSSERSFGRDIGISKRDSEMKGKPTSNMRKHDRDSDGAVSTLDAEHFLSSPPLSTPATTAASREEWTLLIDVQLSPKKALRAATLKSRFADTILKAKQKILLDNGKVDPVKMQLEKEKLERQQIEEKEKIEAQIRAAEAASRLRAEAESKMQREREREAARIALQKMEKTVDIHSDMEILKDLEKLCGCSPADYYFNVEDGSKGLFGEMGRRLFRKPLERLGLFLKEDFIGNNYGDEAILHGDDGEEGEIIP